SSPPRNSPGSGPSSRPTWHAVGFKSSACSTSSNRSRVKGDKRSEGIEPLRYFPAASVDPTDARRSWPARLRTGWCDLRRLVRYGGVEAPRPPLQQGGGV